MNNSQIEDEWKGVIVVVVVEKSRQVPERRLSDERQRLASASQRDTAAAHLQPSAKADQLEQRRQQELEHLNGTTNADSWV